MSEPPSRSRGKREQDDFPHHLPTQGAKAMQIFYVVAVIGITTLISATALVLRSDRRKNRVWAGQWAARLESERQGWYEAQETHEEDLLEDAAAEREAAASTEQPVAGAR